MNTVPMTAVWLLLRSTFGALPGLSVLMLLGLLLLLRAVWVDDDPHRLIWLLASQAFLLGFPLLLAGPQLRRLGSRRRHLLLPGFASAAVCANLLLVTISAALFTLLLALVTPNAALPTPLAALPFPWLIVFVLSSCVFSLLIWFGFLPPWLRLSGWLLIMVLASTQSIAKWQLLDATVLTIAIAMMTGIGWWLFARWLQQRFADRVPFTDPEQDTQTLAMALPSWLHTGPGSAFGTLLLGTSDQALARAQRASIGVVLLPSLLFAAMAVVADMPSQRTVQQPALWFISLVFAFAHYSHLAQRAVARQSLLWLRGDWDCRQLLQKAEAALWRELASAALALLLLASAVHALFGLTAAVVWTLLAWCSALLLQIYLAFFFSALPRQRWLFWASLLQLLLLVSALVVAAHQQWLVPLQGLTLATTVLALLLRWRLHATQR